MRRSTALALIASLVLLVPGAPASGEGSSRAGSSFITPQPPELVPLTAGVQIDPILSAGDVIGGRTGGYQMSGVPDGLGAYRSSPSTIELFMNHELDKSDGDPANARVSHITLNERGRVISGGYALDGSEGFTCFCSSTLRSLDGTPWYFTGEECNSGRGGRRSP